MPHLETEPLIKQYFNIVKDQYPTIDIAHFMLICKIPFRFIRISMERTDMPRIFIRYFGKLYVTSKEFKKKLTKLEKKWNNGNKDKLTIEEYTQRKTFYTNKCEELFKEEQENKKNDLRSSKNRRHATNINQELEIIDDTEN